MHASGFAVGGAMPGAATADALSIEESKFLGGDVEHTHLVKGLDFALLQKVRAQQAARESEEARERADAQRAAASLDTPVFHTSVGRAVYTFATSASVKRMQLTLKARHRIDAIELRRKARQQLTRCRTLCAQPLGVCV